MQSNKQLAAGQRRKLERMSRELVAMAAEWEDLDNYLVHVLNYAAEDIEKAKAAIEVDNEY